MDWEPVPYLIRESRRTMTKYEFMKYLVIIFIIIIIIGLLANRELSRDKKRIKRMLKEYSFRTYSPEDAEENHNKKEAKEKK